jgi:hypothetical protein
MLSGKWFSQIFEPKGVVIDYERISFQFRTELPLNKLAKVIQDFFSKQGAKEVLYIEQENGKFNIEFKFGSIDDINITFHLVKIAENKHIFSISYNSVVICLI